MHCHLSEFAMKIQTAAPGHGHDQAWRSSAGRTSLSSEVSDARYVGWCHSYCLQAAAFILFLRGPHQRPKRGKIPRSADQGHRSEVRQLWPPSRGLADLALSFANGFPQRSAALNRGTCTSGTFRPQAYAAADVDRPNPREYARFRATRHCVCANPALIIPDFLQRRSGRDGRRAIYVALPVRR
jgi:hypothetical protein